MTRTLAAEFSELGVRVNAVSPGAIGTGFFQRSGMADQDMAEFAGPILGWVPLGLARGGGQRGELPAQQ